MAFQPINRSRKVLSEFCTVYHGLVSYYFSLFLTFLTISHYFSLFLDFLTIFFPFSYFFCDAVGRKRMMKFIGLCNLILTNEEPKVPSYDVCFLKSQS